MDLRTFSSVTPEAGNAVSEKKEQSGAVNKGEVRPFLLSEALPAVQPDW